VKARLKKIATLTFAAVAILMLLPWWYVRLPVYIAVVCIAIVAAATIDNDDTPEVNLHDPDGLDL
jgi:MFS superfamily sulfate permease-like transporter